MYLVFFLGTYRIISCTLHDIVPPPSATEASSADVLDKKCDVSQARFALTPRELEVLRCLARGRDVPYIQEQLVVSANTVKAHVKHIYRKMDVHSQQQLIDAVERQELPQP